MTCCSVASPKPLSRQLGQVRGHGGLEVEQPLMRQERGQHARHGLGAGSPGVERVRLHAVQIALVDDAAAVQHDDTVGVAQLDHIVKAELGAEPVAIGHGAEVAQRIGQRRHRPVAAPDVDDVVQRQLVLEAPAVVGAVELIGVGDQAGGVWRKAAHQAEFGCGLDWLLCVGHSLDSSTGAAPLLF